MAQTFTYQDINTGMLTQTKLGNAYTSESVDEAFVTIQDYVKDLEDELKKAKERADNNENDADLFRTLRDELKTNIAKAETAYNDTVKEAKKELTQVASEAQVTNKLAKTELAKIARPKLKRLSVTPISKPTPFEQKLMKVSLKLTMKPHASLTKPKPKHNQLTAKLNLPTIQN